MASQHGDETNNHHVVGISGSLRKASANSGLLRAAEQVVPQGMDIAVFYPRDIPFYNGDVEAKGDPGPVIALKEAIRAADAVLFATPEYNYGTSGVLKNVVDWASRDGTEGSLMGKPVTIIGAGGRALARLGLKCSFGRRSPRLVRWSWLSPGCWSRRIGLRSSIQRVI